MPWICRGPHVTDKFGAAGVRFAVNLCGAAQILIPHGRNFSVTCAQEHIRTPTLTNAYSGGIQPWISSSW
jgi:hypothetical protein